MINAAINFQQFDGPCWNGGVELAVKKHMETFSSLVQVVVGARGQGDVKQLGADFQMPGELFFMLQDPITEQRRMWIGRQFPPPFMCQEVPPESVVDRMSAFGFLRK